MYIVILGSGRVGARLATEFSKAGHEVAVVDKNSSSFRRLGADFHGQIVTGTGIDTDILRKAGIERADAYLALTNGDNTNLMTAQVALQVFRVKKVIARVYDPERAQAYRELGVHTICSTVVMAEQVHLALGEK